MTQYSWKTEEKPSSFSAVQNIVKSVRSSAKMSGETLILFPILALILAKILPAGNFKLIKDKMIDEWDMSSKKMKHNFIESLPKYIPNSHCTSLFKSQLWSLKAKVKVEVRRQTRGKEALKIKFAKCNECIYF